MTDFRFSKKNFSLANKAYLGAGIFVKYCFNLFKYVQKIRMKKKMLQFEIFLFENFLLFYVFNNND